MKFSEPKVLGFPGLPAWMDLPKVKRLAMELDCPEEEARTLLFNQSRGTKPEREACTVVIENASRIDKAREEKKEVVHAKQPFKELREGFIEQPGKAIRPVAYRGTLSDAPRTVGEFEEGDGW